MRYDLLNFNRRGGGRRIKAMKQESTEKRSRTTSKRKVAGWVTHDLMVIAAISIVFAIVLSGLSYFFVMFIIPLGPVIRSIGSGLWFMPAIFVGYIFRRPGAVPISQFIIRVISVPLSAYGWMEIPGGIVVGGGVESILAVTRYRNYSLPVLMMAGVMAGVFRVVARWIPLGIPFLTREMQIAFVVVSLVSGAASGWLGKLLADEVAKTGVLNNYAVRRKIKEEV